MLRINDSQSTGVREGSYATAHEALVREIYRKYPQTIYEGGYEAYEDSMDYLGNIRGSRIY